MQTGSSDGDEANSESVDEVTKSTVIVTYLTDLMQFTHSLTQACQTISQLLGSRSNSDVIEAVSFFVIAMSFNVTDAIVGVRKMLTLMYSKDADVREAVMHAYTALYFTPDPSICTTAKVCVYVMVGRPHDLIHPGSSGFHCQESCVTGQRCKPWGHHMHG